MYVYTHTEIHTHTHSHSPSPRPLFYMGNGMNPHLCLDQQSRSSKGSGGRVATCPDHPRAWAFPGKGFVQLAIFFFLFSTCLPGPQISAPKLLQAMLEKELFERKKMALVVLLWASLRGLVSVNMTAWVGDNVACDAACHWPRIGPTTGLLLPEPAPV